MRIINKQEIDSFLLAVMQDGMTAIAIKGPPTPGDTYSDGEPITNDVNVAWECVETKDRCDIVYGV
jgi:hypothetical protein